MSIKLTTIIKEAQHLEVSSLFVNVRTVRGRVASSAATRE